MRSARTRPTRSVIHWKDVADADPAPTDDADALHAERRGAFFDEARDLGVIIGDHNRDGLLFLLAPSERNGRADYRMLFAKPTRAAPTARNFTRAVTVLKQLGQLSHDDRGGFVDVGAGVGVASVSAVCRHRFSTAVAIESNPDRHLLLRANAVLNGAEDSVSALLAVVGDGKGSLALRRKAGWGEFRVVPPELAAAALNKGKAVSVDCVSIDGLVEEGSIDPATVSLMAISGTGDPFEVLRSATSLGPRTAALVCVDWASLADAHAFNATVDFLRSRFPRLVDMGLSLKDVVLSDSSLIGSLVERHVQAPELGATPVLLLGS